MSIFKSDPLQKTRREVRQLRMLIQKFQGPIVDVKGEFIKRLEKEIHKNVKKGKIAYLKAEYRRYADCPEFMEFWAKDLGLHRNALDNMFPIEVRA